MKNRLLMILTQLVFIITRKACSEEAQTQFYAEYFYKLTMKNLGNHTDFRITPRTHLIRVPKASSSSLSVIARRMTGCLPWGPCCKYPGRYKIGKYATHFDYDI